jgi:putative membrane protein
MITKKNIPFWELFRWSKTPFLWGFIYSSIIAILYYNIEATYKIDISLPWQPIAVLGTTVGFYLGFKNNASYDRTWEARKIWGGILSSSRNFALAINMFFDVQKLTPSAKQEFIYRHLAWLTVLRFQMRLPKQWEITSEIKNDKYFPKLEEHSNSSMQTLLDALISRKELETYNNTSNLATQIINKQGQFIAEFKNNKLISDIQALKFYEILADLNALQGASERIKNFPFPRQYASVTYWLTLVFSLLIPCGFLNIFTTQNGFDFLCAILISSTLIWTYFLMEKIGHFSENPFQGSITDVPITSISNQIEIELRQIIGDLVNVQPEYEEKGFIM